MQPRIALLALVLATSSGCSKCGRDHPYVPYSIGEGGPNATPSASGTTGTGAAPDAGEFAAREGMSAPPNVSQWILEGLTLDAPAGRTFDVGLAADVDGDGAIDAVTLVRAATAPEQGEVLLYKGTAGGKVAPPATLATLPTLATDAGCLAGPTPTPTRARLAIIGGPSALVDVSPACPARSSKDASRWIAVLALGGATAPRAPRLQLFVTDPDGSPPLTFDADGADRDGDGAPDVTLRVSLEGGGAPFEPGPRVSAVLRWFDRPAGLSRDPDEPDASLRARSGALLARAARTKDAASVPVEARQLRWLYGALCAEGGAPRLARGEGARIPCGSSRALEEAGLAEARAFATMGDPLRAITALDRAQRPPATKTAARATEGQAWITQSAPVASSATLRAVGAVPQIDRGKAPAWGALAFEASGKLLVRTLAGVVRVDPATGDEAAAEDVATWKTQVIAPDGRLRFIEAYGACDGLALRATFAPTSDADPKDVVLPIAPPLGDRCTTAKGEPARVLPLAWGSAGLEAVIAGSPLLFPPDLARASDLLAPLDQQGPLGSPRSPNGRVMAVPTSMGILVRAGKGRLFRAKELDGGYGELRDCTVADDAAHVACVRGGRAFVGTWDDAK